MPFRFNMQKVLDYREQLEEEAKVALARAREELRKGQKRLDSLLAELAEAEAKSTEQMLNSAELWLHDQYLKGLRADVKEASLQVRMLEQMAEEARKTLAARAMDRKLLEKLKERRKTQYIKTEQKQEQYFNDEIATIRYKAPAI